jgi:hypothetical protein
MRESGCRVSRSSFLIAVTDSVSPLMSMATPFSGPLSTMRFRSIRFRCGAKALFPPRKRIPPSRLRRMSLSQIRLSESR